MATLNVPESVPSPGEDAEQLRKAFQGCAVQSDPMSNLFVCC